MSRSFKVRRLTMVTLLALGTVVPILAAPSAQAGSVGLVVTAPSYESPGGTVPIVVTSTNLPPATTTLGATVSPAGSVSCTSTTWLSPITNGFSRLCYMTTPKVARTYVITPTAYSPTTTPKSWVGSKLSFVAKGYVTNPLSMSRIQSIEKCGNTTSNVILTFDDYIPSTATADSMAATLKKNNVKATFYLNFLSTTNRNKLLAAGQIIENHTKSHLALNMQTTTKIHYEIVNGPKPSATPKTLRPPYGAGSFTARLVALAAQDGYSLCRWTTDTRDWAGTSASVMAQKVRYGDASTPPVYAGGVILMHANHYTPAKLQAVIDAVHARGLTIRPIS